MQPGDIKTITLRNSRKTLLFLLVIAIHYLPCFSQAAMDEGRVRAAVIFHIIALTQWPESSGKPDFSRCILVLGQDPSGIAGILATRIKEGNGKGKGSLRITALTDPGEMTGFKKMLADCQILYLTRDGMQYLPLLSPLLAHRSILTISEIEEFCDGGAGMICLTIKNQRLSIQINHQLASGAGFHFSAELLRHAVLVSR